MQMENLNVSETPKFVQPQETRKEEPKKSALQVSGAVKKSQPNVKEFSEFEVANPEELPKVVKRKPTKKETENPEKRAETAEAAGSNSATQRKPRRRPNKKEAKEKNNEDDQQNQEEPKPEKRKPQPKPKPKMVVPKEEFDFDASNAKFSREEEAEVPEVQELYYEKTSFFDNISTEVKDRASRES